MGRWWLAAAAAVLALAGPSAAPAAVKLAGPERVKPNQLVRVSATSTDPDVSSYTWDVTPDDKADVEVLGDRIVFVGPPGRYRVVCRSAKVDGKAIRFEEARMFVTVEGPDPTPPPGPGPGPAPPGKGDPVAATARLVVGRSGCTATPIWPPRPDGKWDVLTASHCVPGVGSKGVITLRDGRSVPVTVTVHDKVADLAWMVTDGPVKDMPYALLKKELPALGSPMWQNGYGVSTKSVRRDGTVIGADPSRPQIQVRCLVSSGDSGGPCFLTATGEVIASVCCGGGGTFYGGSSVAAWKLRPKEVKIEDTIEPVPLPEMQPLPVRLPRPRYPLTLPRPAPPVRCCPPYTPVYAPAPAVRWIVDPHISSTWRVYGR